MNNGSAMPDSALEDIRNIGIIAHIDAGKTTTTEAILYYTGASHRIGKVDDGTTITDFDAEEAKRGITIYSAAITCHWNGKTINLIDTPGHVDFTAEVERSLRVLDGAVVVFSAVEGVEAQSETVWRQADRYGVPRICFVNKMDRIGADFERTFDEIGSRLEAQPLAIQIPMGAGSPPDPDAFVGIIDLVAMTALYFDADSKGEVIEEKKIPNEFVESARSWRQKLLETVALLDDSAMESYIETEDIPADQIHDLLRVATILGKLQPVFCGTALNYCGVQPILDGVVRYLPTPLDRPPVEGTHPSPKKKDEPQLRKASPGEPFSCLIFKVLTDQHTDLCFVRVYSGTLKSGSRVLNPRTGKKELVSQIWRVQADSREKIEANEISAGDIAGIIGPKDVVTGDTLCDAHRPILLESITFPETVISMAVEPDSNAERKKLEDVLARLAKQDPTFNTRVSEESGQTIISGMGELHLEVLRERMQRDFGLNVRVHKPRVTYRETVQDTTEATGEFSRKSGESVQYSSVTLRVGPFEGESSVTLVNKLKPGTLPNELVEILTQAVLDASRSGGIVGCALMKVKFTILDAVYRPGETTEVAVEAAAADAVQNCLNRATAILLEPIMRLEIVTPDSSRGNIQADLNARRAVVINSERRGDLCVLEANAALSEMFGYSTKIRSLSQGRASFTMEPLKYDQAPPGVLKEMLR